MNYRESLAERVERLKQARELIEGQMIELLKGRIRKEVNKQVVALKENIESVLNENPNQGSVSDGFWIRDDLFDAIDEKEQNQELRLEALISVVFEKLAELGWTKFRFKAKRERAKLIGRWIGIRTYYVVEVELPIRMSDSDVDLLNNFRMNGMIASEKFIDRIKTGVLKPTEEPGSRFRRLAAEAGVTPKQAAEDIVRAHTGQNPKYIKIERKGTNEHGNETTRER